MISQPRLLFRVDAGQQTGMGHLARCLVLAERARASGFSARFLIYGSSNACELVKGRGFDCAELSVKSLGEQAASLSDEVEKDEIVILDFIHSNTLKESDQIPELLRQWKQATKAVVLIDGAGKQSAHYHCNFLEADILISPYVDEISCLSKCRNVLSGAFYTILPEGYQNFLSRNIKIKPEKILITCGGSDPESITARILKIFEEIDDSYELRVVIGPMFSRELKESLRSLAQRSHNDIEFVDSPRGLADHMLRSDLAISTTGLTKYELAATGTPAVLVSIDAAHDEANLSFSRAGTAKYLGVIHNIQDSYLKDSIVEILGSYPGRRSMSEKGKSLIDGLGAARIIDAIGKLN